MKPNETQLRQLFIRATDEIIPPAPWLEAHVVAAVKRRPIAPTRIFDLRAVRDFMPGLRLTAGVVAVIITLVAVAALLMSSRLLHRSAVPGSRSSVVQPSIIPFEPSPAVRATYWPPGGPVPAALAAAWQQSPSDPKLYLAGYTFQFGEQTDGPNINPLAYGNVVVNGSEIDFLSDACTGQGFGFERYDYTLSDNTLVLARASGLGQTDCAGDGRPYWPSLAGSYSRASSIQTPVGGIVPFTPSPAVRDASWPPGGPVPADLAGAWQQSLSSPLCRASAPSGCVLHLGGNTFQVGEEYTNPPPPGNVNPVLYGNVVVNGSEIDFMSDVCTTQGAFGFERYRYTLSGNTLVLVRAQGAGQVNCGGKSTPYWPNLAGSYSRVPSE